MGSRRLKRRVREILARPRFGRVMEELSALPPREVVSPLIGAFCDPEQQVRRHAVMAMGPVVAALADEDMEAARIVMRRLLWSLNDESGGIGWGAPEAMAHVMAAHPGLADEYLHMLISYMREDGEEIWQDGNFLEHPGLQKDLLRGIGHLARVMPAELRRRGVRADLLPYLGSTDPEVRALAARALGLLTAGEDDQARAALEALVGDPAPVTLHEGAGTRESTVGAEARAVLEHLERARQGRGGGDGP